MELSPRLYHWFVRPKWFTKLYMNTKLKTLFRDYDFNDKFVLDFGCGIGSNCSLFNPESYIGVDYDKKRIEYANYLYGKYNFNVLNSPKLSFLDNSIDYIFIMAVLHHISSNNLDLYLKEFNRVLKPNGEILIIEPCYFSKAYLSNNYMRTFDKGKYIRTEDQYLKLFNNCGFETKVLEKFTKCFYNEIFFTASNKTYIIKPS